MVSLSLFQLRLGSVILLPFCPQFFQTRNQSSRSKKPSFAPYDNYSPTTMSALVASLTICFATQTGGLCYFNNVAKLVADTSRGIPRLLQKGNLKDIHTNLVNLSNGEEELVFRKDGCNYWVDPRLAIAFVKNQRADLGEAVVGWESTYGRADIPEELTKDAPQLLRHLTSVFSRDNFRCTFQDGKWYFCLNDVVQAATEDPKTHMLAEAWITFTDLTRL